MVKEVPGSSSLTHPHVKICSREFSNIAFYWLPPEPPVSHKPSRKIIVNCHGIKYGFSCYMPHIDVLSSSLKEVNAAWSGARWG